MADNADSVKLSRACREGHEGRGHARCAGCACECHNDEWRALREAAMSRLRTPSGLITLHSMTLLRLLTIIGVVEPGAEQ